MHKVIALKKVWKNCPLERKLCAIRTLLICSFVAAAVTCTTLAYTILHGIEVHSFEYKFVSVSSSALNTVEGSFLLMNTGVQILSTAYGDLFPTAEVWPNVMWKGFHPLVNLLGTVTAMDNMAVLPLVRAHEVTSFEGFISEFYKDNHYVEKDQFHHPAFPNISVWAQDFSDPNSLPYHDLTGKVPFSSKAILTPVAQYTTSEFFGPHLGGYNVHSSPLFAGSIDKAIDCVTAENLRETTLSSPCGQLSEVFPFPSPTVENPDPELQDMVALTFFPIFPHDNNTLLTGFSAGGISWRKLLMKVVPKFVGDVDCVVRTQAHLFTMRIQQGIPHMVGLGDLHENKFSEYGASGKLSDNAGVSLTFYPTQDFADNYVTNDPLFTALTLLGVFVFCAFLFFLYDVLMHREFGKRQAVLDTKRRFVRFISHEIRTPLNTVRLGLKLFEAELKKLLALFDTTPTADLSALIASTVQNWAQLTQDILVSSESAVEVLNDLLNYDKIEMGTLHLEFSLFSIGDVIKRTASIMQMEAQQKDINLEVDLCASGRDQNAAQLEDSCVVGDKGRLAQVLRNLVSNALKFTPTGGNIRLSVELQDRPMKALALPLRTQEQSELYAAHPATGLIAVSVTDSGAGLSPQQLAEICTEGVQFNANELQAGQGSGLGLFISKGIVEQHGGKLTVTSEGVGKGATFTIELPCVHAKRGDLDGGLAAQNKKGVTRCSDPQAHYDADLTPPPGSPSTSMARIVSDLAIATPKRLLVVDDSHFNRKMLTRLLTSKDYVCEQAEDGAKAIEKYTAMRERGDAVDAILMDFEMPVMNGPTATKRLREMGCSCLIVGVTGNVLPADLTLFKQHGADAVLPKPLVLEDFERLFVDHQEALQSKPRPSTLPVFTGSLKVHPVQNI